MLFFKDENIMFKVPIPCSGKYEGSHFQSGNKKIGIFHPNKEVIQLAKLETLMGHYSELLKGNASADT